MPKPVADVRYADRFVTYLFGYGEGDMVIDGFGAAMFMNHCCTPNCETQERDERIFVVALRPIKAGEELVYEYNLWDSDESTQDCYCGAPNCRGTMFFSRGGRAAREARHGGTGLAKENFRAVNTRAASTPQWRSGPRARACDRQQTPQLGSLIMRIFLTGATGFIGSAIIPELLGAGYKVLGLTRSDEGAKALVAAGVEPHHGNIEDLESLRQGAAKTDGIIHCGFNHDFSRFVENCENDRRAIEAMGAVLAGSNRPLVITSGVGMGNRGPGVPATEDVFDREHPHPRKASEEGGLAAAALGVSVSVVRLPQVHDTRKQGLLTPYIGIVKEKGKVAYVGAGENRFSAAHVLDVARLYRLALERNEAGSRYNAVAEEGVAMREIAEVIGRGLKLPVLSVPPEEAPAHLGWMAMFASLDLPATSDITRSVLSWTPTGPGLLEDLANMNYA